MLKEIFEIIREFSNKIFSFNSVWLSIGYSEYSFLFCLKILFFIVFILLNFGLIYLEYLEKKKKKYINNRPLKAGIAPDLKRLASQVAVALGTISGIITVNFEYFDHKKAEKAIADYDTLCAKVEEDGNKVADKITNDRFTHRLQLVKIKNSFSGVVEHSYNESELLKEIKKCEVDWAKDNDPKHITNKLILETKLQAESLKKDRCLIETKEDINNSMKFNGKLSTETDNEKLLKMINEDDIHKSSIFDLDLEILWNRFETFDAITKTACIMILSSSIVFSCLFAITINLYGNYLISRFKLEERYPRVAIFINYRIKVSKYFILSNIIYIFITCLINLFYGLTILEIIYTS